MPGILALVLLRVGIGFHFYSEGIKKVRNPQPYSAGFLGSAKGRLAPMFHNMVWDADALSRLKEKDSLAIWDNYRDQAIRHYGLNSDQAKEAEQIYKQRKGQLQWWLAVNRNDIREYKLGLDRRDRYHQDPQRMEVASLRGQVTKLEGELAAKRRELSGPIDMLWEGYVADIHKLGGGKGSPLSIKKPGRRFLDSESIDFVIRYFDVALGVLLIIGLFTRTAAVLGAVFLCSVMASQWPGSPGAIPVWSQFIETLGLLAVGALGAGRFAGLDFVTGSLRQWCCPPNNQGTES